MTGQIVNWVVVSGGGSVVPSAPVTNSEGLAQARWTLGRGGAPSDTQLVEAQTKGSTSGAALIVGSFQATALAGAAAVLSAVGGNQQSGQVGSTLAAPLVVKVTDSLGNPVARARITWRVTSGGGSVSPALDSSGMDGTGKAQWTLGNTAGPNSLTATTPGAPQVAFTATATAGPPGVGVLAVTVTSPPGVAGAITITGPNNFQRSISSSQTFKGLTPGGYPVLAATVTVAGASYYGAVTGSPALVAGGATSNVGVTYTARPIGNGSLWVSACGLSGNPFVEYSPTQLQVQVPVGAPIPEVALGSPTLTAGVAIDADGDLWGATLDPAQLLEYTPAQQIGGGNPTPAVTITTSAPTIPAQDGALAFDARGNLWVANWWGNTLIEFSRAQLAVGGDLTPAVTILTPGGGSLPNTGFAALAFDSHGNLWVANSDTRTLLGYAASQLLASGTPTPAVTITLPQPYEPRSLAFDRNGNLWITAPPSFGQQAQFQRGVFGYSPAQLAQSGSPTPAHLVNLPDAISGGMAFDSKGNLWVTGTNAIAEFTPAQLAAGGTLTALILIRTDTFCPMGLAFDPPPPGLPVR